MNKNVSILVIIIVLITTGFFYLNKNKITTLSPLATSTPIIITNKNTELVDGKVSWLRYENNELGVSFDYYGYPENNFRMMKGDTGRQFNASFVLPSKTQVFMTSRTTDYSIGKGETTVGSWGYGTIGGKYYLKNHDKLSDFEIHPDETWLLGNGDTSLVFIGKNFGPEYEYDDLPIWVTLNTKNKEFPGIGLQVYYEGGNHKITDEDIEYIKRIISSIKFSNSN